MVKWIGPGTVNDLKEESGDWLFVDVGFSSKKKSCGVLKHKERPQPNMMFGELVDFVVKEAQIQNSDRPLNLLLEAPLSVVVDKDGNPARRSTDIEEGKGPRDWWYNAGASTLLATGHLLRRVKDCGVQREVKLFEGLASFKSGSSTSNHANDVVSLRCAAWGNPKRNLVTCRDKLKMEGRGSDTLESAFEFAGMDFGIPPVVKACNNLVHTSDHSVIICIDGLPPTFPA